MATLMPFQRFVTSAKNLLSTSIFLRSQDMKKTTRKYASMVVLAIAATANAPAGLADSYNGSLGASNAATDVYGLTCPIGTATVRARVTNPNGSPADEIIVEVINPNGRVGSAISLEGVAPPTAVLAGVAGNYLVTLHKSPSVTASYNNLVLDCYNAGAVAFPGTQSALVQNQ
jgi:hypothetical protein